MAKKMIYLALALTGSVAAAGAYVAQYRERRRDARLHKEDLKTWEGEGGKPASPAMRPARAS